MSESYVEAKVVLENAKSSYCGGTTNMTNDLKACHKEGYKSLQTVEAPILVLFMISGLLKKITYFANLRRVKINRRLIGAVFY